MNRSSIITMVREKLDEVSVFENVQIDDVDLIEKRMDDSAINFLMVAPLNTMRGYKIPTTTYTEVMDDVDKGIGILPLPDDFLRLHAIKVDAWQKVVTVAYDDTSAVANLQKSKVTRGGFVKPVALLSWTESSTSDSIGAGLYYKKVLYLYSVPDKATFDIASYIPRLLPEHLPDNLVDPLTWQIAGDVLTITGNQQQAGVCYAHVQKFIKDNDL